MFFEVIPTETYRSNGGALTYSSGLRLTPGQVVLIPLGKRTITGVVYRQVPPVNFHTKPIARLLYATPIPQHLLASSLWLAKYYLSPLTSTISLMIPNNLNTRTAFKHLSNTPSPTELKLPLIPLNSAQKTALQSLQEAPGTTSLLRGITGSGKTNIYLTLTAKALAEQKSAILLVPEIALTSQLVKIFSQTFGNRVILIHSGQTLTERRKIWLQINETTCAHDATPCIVIGPRSALLAPIHNLGLIMIDEAHESAYFQENTPRYSTLRLASFIAQHLKIPCIFGSATPNIVEYHLAKSKNSLIELSTKAKTTAIDPSVSIVDLKDRKNFTKNRYFSNQLLTEIQKNIQDNHQTLIFHNRRGSAPLTLCENCGWQALCPECFLPMTLHTDGYTLCCHICGNSEKVPTSCPNCHQLGIIHKGFGTKLLESELGRLFPDTRIARFDGDNKKDHNLASLYSDVKSGKIQILIGTQTLARGLDLPHLATVGIIQADSGLALPDFAAEERTFELLTQVIGRIGRGHLNIAHAIVQTFQPEHPVVQTALKSDFSSFAEYLIKQRRHQKMPPFSHLAKLSVTYKTEKTTLAKIQQAHASLTKVSQLTVSPPMPAFHERTSRGFTWQIILKSTSRRALQEALTPFALTQQFSVTLDPPSLL